MQERRRFGIGANEMNYGLKMVRRWIQISAVRPYFVSLGETSPSVDKISRSRLRVDHSNSLWCHYLAQLSDFPLEARRMFPFQPLERLEIFSQSPKQSREQLLFVAPRVESTLRSSSSSGIAIGDLTLMDELGNCEGGRWCSIAKNDQDPSKLSERVRIEIS